MFKWINWRRSKPETLQQRGFSALSFGLFGNRDDPQWFQKGGGIPSMDEARSHAAVYSCVNILSQEIGKLRIRVYREEKDGSRTPLDSGQVSTVLQKPNQYQTRSDFFLNMMSNLLYNGNAYAVAERDTNGRIIGLHPRPVNTTEPWIIPETGEIFYSMIKIDLDDALFQKAPENFLVPARDMLHLKLDTPGHPLVGVTPLTGCYYAVNQGINIQQNSTSFFKNMSRPSGILTTPNKLGDATAARLKESFGSRNSTENAGKVPVLDNGLTWESMTLSAADSQMIEQYNMSVSDIAMVYRVPLYMLGDLTKTTYTNVEQMQKGFQAGSLGFYTEHIEAALDGFFRLPANQFIEFDLDHATIRTEFKNRMEGFSRAITGGVMKINEARRKEGLSPVEGGDEIYLQRQNWPLDLLGADGVQDLKEVTTEGNPPTDPVEPDDDEKAFEDLEKAYSLLESGHTT